MIRCDPPLLCRPARHQCVAGLPILAAECVAKYRTELRSEWRQASLLIGVRENLLEISRELTYMFTFALFWLVYVPSRITFHPYFYVVASDWAVFFRQSVHVSISVANHHHPFG